MIRPLRQRHRTMMVLLVLAVPALFVAGLMVRPTPPVVPQLILDSPGSRVEVASWADDLWHGARIRTGFTSDDGWVLEPLEELASPLLYYAPPDVATPLSSLPREAILLGSLSGSRSVVRRARGVTGGATLILYDLERQAVTAWAVLPAGAAS